MRVSPAIRPAVQADAAEIARLSVDLTSCYSSEIETRLAALGASDRAFVAVAPGAQSTITGWVSAEQRLLLQSGERVEIVGLIVDPAFRRQGIGRALVSAVEHWAISKDLSTITVRSNIARIYSHSFYEELGFRRTKTQHCYVRQLSSV